MTDKVIVTNISALKQKYDEKGLKNIQAAVKALIDADKKRGLSTSLIALDDATQMGKLKAPVVKNAGSYRENKNAIDGVYKALAPDYLMILGAIDVIPHQDLKNPMFSTDPDGDDDRIAWGDLPYACDAPYSRNIKDFTGPTRVVGRLPDITGQDDSKYLVGLLKTASSWQGRQKSDYSKCLGISAEKWQESTAESLTNIFGSDTSLHNSPTEGFKWSKALINRRSHFVNCHGGDVYPFFLGQASDDDDNMPESHSAAFVALTGKILEGTVMSAECCYGGQLYNPSAEQDSHQMGMCNTYLAKKAYGFFGSTTIAYGPFSGNDQADLICQFFLQRVLAGASLGRATLEARQRFIERCSPLSPMNRKTLAQFNLYGDPSITPVDVKKSKAATSKGGSKALTKRFVGAKAVQDGEASERADRRATLRVKGEGLKELQPQMSESKAGPPKSIESSLKNAMKTLNYTPLPKPVSFKVKSTGTPTIGLKSAMAKGISKAVKEKKNSTTGFHIMFGKPKDGSVSKTATAKSIGKKAKGGVSLQCAPIKKFVVLEAKEVEGKIVSITEAHSK